MTVRPRPGARHPVFSRSADARHETPAAEAVAFRHEHGRLYDALERTAQIAELAGHDILAAALRRDRRDVSAELTDHSCTLAPRPLDDAELAFLTRRTIRELEEVDDGR